MEPINSIKKTCYKAWQRQLLSGFNGNVSIRQGHEITITRSGAAKGALRTQDICVLNLQGELLSGAKPSSEASMHVRIYAQRPDVEAIVHCHPRHLLALEIYLSTVHSSLQSLQENFLKIPIFEAQMLKDSLAFAPDFAPGSEELAQTVAECATHHDAIWMAQHGLTCVGKDAVSALALAEELEHLAAVQLLARGTF